MLVPLLTQEDPVITDSWYASSAAFPSLSLLACVEGKAAICPTVGEISSREPVPTLAARDDV